MIAICRNLGGLVLAIPLLAPAAEAQVLPRPNAGTLERSLQGQRQLELPPPRFAEPETTPPLVAPTPEHAPTEHGGGLRVLVREIRIEGSTVFSTAEMAAVAAPYLNRMLSFEDLLALRDALTLHYVQQGYLNSGAVIPDQDVSSGVVVFQIVEGHLSTVEVQGNRWFRRDVLERKLALPGDRPLRLDDLRRHLERLQQDSRIRRLQAELRPGLRPGEAVLGVDVEEYVPYTFGLEFNNQQAPAVGSERGEIRAAHRNLLGLGDTLAFQFGITSGLDDLDLNYALPLNARDTTLSADWQRSRSKVVESPFDRLDIRSKTDLYGLALRQPLFRNTGRELAASIGFDYRASRTFLLGDPFSFSPGADNGESTVVVLRLTQEWTDRQLNQVLAFRSRFSVGLDVFDATKNGPGVPDGRFWAWLGQAQLARRIDERGDQVIVRVDAQLTPDPLLSIEQFALGGALTVRGYRENQIVRDNGAVGSVEGRFPVLRGAAGRDLLQLAAFGDVGAGWAADGRTPDPKYLASVGLGLRGEPLPGLHFAFYWGQKLKNVTTPGGDPQDKGIHMQVSYDFNLPERAALWVEPWRETSPRLR